jgi:hypothetical protein
MQNPLSHLLAEYMDADYSAQAIIYYWGSLNKFRHDYYLRKSQKWKCRQLLPIIYFFKYLIILGETPGSFLGEYQLAILDHLKYAAIRFDQLGIDPVALFQSFGQTGRFGIVISNHAVFNRDFHTLRSFVISAFIPEQQHLYPPMKLKPPRPPRCYLQTGPRIPRFRQTRNPEIRFSRLSPASSPPPWRARFR